MEKAMNAKALLVLIGAAALAAIVVPYTLADDLWPALAQVTTGDEPQPPLPPPGRGPGVEGVPRGPGGEGPGRGGYGRGPGGGEGPGRTMGPMEPMRRLLHSSPEIQQMDTLLQTVMRMRHVAFEPESAGLIAVGGLKDDRRKSAEIIEDLEKLLKQTKTLGLRNSIRLTLRDLYRAERQDEKALEHLRVMLRENDDAIQAEEKGKK